MTIKVGDRVPDVRLKHMTPNGPAEISTTELFKGKTVALFALPGAFTPTCSAKHVPGFLGKYGELKAKGVDTVACLSVNDAFVMGAWGKDQKVEDKILMLADGSGEFTKAVGLSLDLTPHGMGVRS
jgi:peroxiredoxin